MRARRSISVTICAELTQSLKPQRAAPPGAARCLFMTAKLMACLPNGLLLSFQWVLEPY